MAIGCLIKGKTPRETLEVVENWIIGTDDSEVITWYAHALTEEKIAMKPTGFAVIAWSFAF